MKVMGMLKIKICRLVYIKQILVRKINIKIIAKYPEEITSKMKKKFPDYLKPEKSKENTKSYIENDKLIKMKSKIDKMFYS